MAHGAWKQVRPPGTGDLEFVAVADAATWLVQRGQDGPLQLTANGGGSWSPVSVESPLGGGAAADGSFRVVAEEEGEEGEVDFRIHRITAAASASPLGSAIPSGAADPATLDPVVDDDGTTWIPFWDENAGAVTVGVVESDGDTSAVAVENPQVTGSSLQSQWKSIYKTVDTALGLRLVERSVNGQTLGGTRRVLRLADGKLVPAESRPIATQDGFLTTSTDGQASWNGGVSWASLEGEFVSRAPGLGPRRLLLSAMGGFHQRLSDSMYRRSTLPMPSSWSRRQIVDAGGALLAWNKDVVNVHVGVLPTLPTSFGTLQPNAARLLERANLLRADAGFPSLVGDPVASRAAYNHSRYLLLNEDESGHDEQPGHPGFTGVRSSERCAAVGGSCGGEVVFGAGEWDPVGQWLATPFHRILPGAPTTWLVGAGRAHPGSAAVMVGSKRPAVAGFSSSWQDVSKPMRPLGFPNGRWRGAGDFVGENPDPAAHCRRLGFDVDWPLGATVTLYIPDPEGQVTSVRIRPRGGSPLRGCFLVDSVDGLPYGSFIPDDALVPGTTYDAEGTWTSGGGTLTHRWSFTHLPGNEGLGPKPDIDVDMVLVSGRLKLDRKRRVRVKLRCPRSEKSPPCRGSVSLRTARKVGGRKKARKRVQLTKPRRYSLGNGKAKTLTLRLSRARARLVRRRKAARSVVLSLTVRDRVGNSGALSWNTTLRVPRPR